MNSTHPDDIAHAQQVLTLLWDLIESQMRTNNERGRITGGDLDWLGGWIRVDFDMPIMVFIGTIKTVMKQTGAKSYKRRPGQLTLNWRS